MYSVLVFSALTIPHHTNRIVLAKKYSEVTIEKCYKGQDLLSLILYFFLSLQTRKSIGMLRQTNCFHFAKIDNHYNESGMKVKKS
jgi:hypothetical protein